MEPLQVMPLDADFNLLSGPLDYESLQWNRKYYETGDFSMSVLSSDYDPSWAYIYTPFRPEMGVIQKVEFADTSHTPDGKDTVTVSGFFMEHVLDKLVFLVEQTEEEKVIVPKPSRPSKSTPMPNLKQDADGNLYFEYAEGTASHHYNSVETGECIWPDQVEGEESWTDVPLQAGDGMSEERYPVRDAQGNVVGDFGSGWYNASYNYYSSSDGKLHVVKDDGSESTYDLVGNGTNAVVYKDGDDYKWVWGVVEEGEEGAKDKYRREVEEWEQRTKSLQVDDDGNYFYYRTVKGPWQLRTDIDDVTTPQDNVQWVIKMAQKVFGNNFFYDEPDFSGETKVLSPSLTRIGDFFRQELKTIEAGLRIFYSFKANQMIFQIWRGLDRTQDENAPGADDPVTNVMALSADPLTDSDYQLPDGYTQLEYIESTGTQYINTGFIPNQNTRAVLDIESDEDIPECHVFGSRAGMSSDEFCVLIDAQLKWRTDYGTSQVTTSSAPRSGRILIDKNKATTAIGTVTLQNTAQTFSAGFPMYLFAINTAGSTSTFASVKLHSSQIYDNGTLVRDFIPARRANDSAVGLYDSVSGQFYENAGSGSFSAGPVVVKPVEDQLTYYPNSLTATGSTPPTAGYQGQPVVVAQCGFIDSQRTFTGWNTSEGGTGTTYQPGSEYILTEGDDRLYAQWSGVDPDPGPDVPGGNAWAVFSDTWGSLYDYSASVDDSNYRNLCYVLHEYDEPAWDDDGHPVVEEVTGEYMTEIIGYRVKYTRQRGQWVVRLEDDYEDRETWLDKRDEKPEQDQDWPRDMQEEMPDVSGVTKESYDQFKTALMNEGRSYLEENYAIVKNLDTGTLDTADYLTGFDLGDKVDMAVSTIGLKETARIIEVDEVHESGRSEVHLIMGDEIVTNMRKAVLN